MTMQKRHFELIAAVLRDIKPIDADMSQRAGGKLVQWVETVDAFVVELKKTSPQFRELQFRNACSQ